MKWPGVTINTTMLAAAIRIDARLEAHVRAVVVGDDGTGMVLEKQRAWQRVFLRIPIRVAFEMDRLEAVGGIARRAAGGNGIRFAEGHADRIAQMRRNEMVLWRSPDSPSQSVRNSAPANPSPEKAKG